MHRYIGYIDQVGILDLLNLCSRGKLTGAAVLNRAGDFPARIDFDYGNIALVHYKMLGLDEAYHELLEWRDGSFVITGEFLTERLPPGIYQEEFAGFPLLGPDDRERLSADFLVDLLSIFGYYGRRSTDLLLIMDDLFENFTDLDEEEIPAMRSEARRLLKGGLEEVENRSFFLALSDELRRDVGAFFHYLDRMKILPPAENAAFQRAVKEEIMQFYMHQWKWSFMASGYGDYDKQRKHPRVEVRLRAVIRFDDIPGATYARPAIDLSMGGLLVLDDRGRRPGVRGSVELQTPNFTPLLTSRCEVVRKVMSREESPIPVGMGMRFLEPSPLLLVRLRRVVERAAR